MTINPYILNGLYQKGIIDYVPMDLGFAPNVSSMNYVSGDAYMKSAMQGAMYQNYGYGSDSYTRNFNQQIGTHSAAADNALTLQGIGGSANVNYAAFGDPRIGSHAPSAVNALGFSDSDSQYNVAENALGGFSDVKRSYNQTMTAIHNTPTIVKGVISALIGIGGIYLFLKKGKKPKQPKQSLLSRLNPMNWFKSAKKNSK